MEAFAYEPVSEDIRVVVGVSKPLIAKFRFDIFTNVNYSNLLGFAYAYVQENKEKIEIVVNDEWGNFKSPNKTNTALQYDETYRVVVNWGAGALSSEPTKRRRLNLPKPIEYFKFYLGDDVPDSKKPRLPQEITFEKAISDFLREMGK
ncbi:16634_t:CDS:2 [Racocetra fulgida]|uniref:16634_t:CDS:1 n=1 Tax=Racocetra fulgida TaxID=60492 RepID=A0A9N9C9S4_9GLOM|nr:16634_t:CDS:2 [Racocetra fulgida]